MISSRIDLWPQRALVIARFGEVSVHAHINAALLVGIDGPFAFRLHPDERIWQPTHAIFLGAGVSHELRCDQTLMGLLYLAPGRLDQLAFCTRYDLQPNLPVQPVYDLQRVRETLLALAAGEVRQSECDDWVENHLAGEVPLRTVADRRVGLVARLIAQESARNWALTELAQHVQLSPSRLQHLFLDELGATPRQLRTWERMRAVSAAMASGSTLTQAAHHAGFTDSAHLSRMFRHSFGVAPSRVLGRGTRVHVRSSSHHGPPR